MLPTAYGAGKGGYSRQRMASPDRKKVELMIHPLTVPDVPFATIAHRMKRLFSPFSTGNHTAIYGRSGSGKSYLIRHGILPALAPIGRVLVLDVKQGHSKTWKDWGRLIEKLPGAFGHDADNPDGLRFRLAVSRDRDEARKQVKRALDQVREEGHCVVVVDETRVLVENQQLALGSPVELLVNTGRESGITMILGQQNATWTPASVRDGVQMLWIGPQSSRKSGLTLAEIAGGDRALAMAIGNLPPRHWIYRDTFEAPIMATTSLG